MKSGRVTMKLTRFLGDCVRDENCEHARDGRRTDDDIMSTFRKAFHTLSRAPKARLQHKKSPLLSSTQRHVLSLNERPICMHQKASKAEKIDKGFLEDFWQLENANWEREHTLLVFATTIHQSVLCFFLFFVFVGAESSKPGAFVIVDHW